MFNQVQINRFCNLKMRMQPERYKLKDEEGKGFNFERMANDFIFEHALEDHNIRATVLQSIHGWWEQWNGAATFKQTL